MSRWEVIISPVATCLNTFISSGWRFRTSISIFKPLSDLEFHLGYCSESAEKIKGEEASVKKLIYGTHLV
jgi:hypothetical protein